jgi:hypothetical protein
MKRMKKLILLSLTILSLVVLYSCEEEFEINAPYQDITVVYGLVDQGQDSIFVKINKAFLGDGNILEMAKIEDSSEYVNGLEAVIEEWNEGNFIRSYALQQYTISNKDTGTFYNPYQVIYSTPYEPNQNNEYRLTVRVNDDTVTASTSLVNNFSIDKPSAGSKFIQFKPDTDGSVEWKSAKNGRRYEVVIRFFFKEMRFDSPDTVYRYIDWGLGTRKSLKDSGGQEMGIEFKNNSFYAIISDRIPYDDQAAEDNVKERFTNDVDVIIAVAADDLNTYMEVNEPSNSIVQDKPDYTNISNGIGLFSSRFKNIRTKKVGLETVDAIKDICPELKFVF